MKFFKSIGAFVVSFFSVVAMACPGGGVVTLQNGENDIATITIYESKVELVNKDDILLSVMTINDEGTSEVCGSTQNACGSSVIIEPQFLSSTDPEATLGSKPKTEVYVTIVSEGELLDFKATGFSVRRGRGCGPVVGPTNSTSSIF